ncbi:MAG: hypothetical protein HQL07_07440 [Nitrospirae bacterium]|nr:hypothetical protein [Magnetococcales bacterium]
MKLYTEKPWFLVESLAGEESAEGDSWRKLVETQGLWVLLVQRGAWCGVRQEAYVLETWEERENWRSLPIP